MTPLILVVDDNAEFAQQVGELLKTKTGLESAFASDPDAAVAAAESHPIAVAVLDQKMPLMSGTKLFEQLRLIQPDIRAIMLTGEASADEVGETLKLGYDDYLHKGRISELPERVLTVYVRYLTKQATVDLAAGDVVWPRGFWRQRRSKVQVRLISSVELDPAYVAADSWRTVLHLNAGEERKLTSQVTQSHEVSLDEESTRTLRHTLNLKAPLLADAISSIAEASSSMSRRKSVRQSLETAESSEQTLRLPPQAEQAVVPHVRARHFQHAEVFSKRMVMLHIRCRCCDLRAMVPVRLLETSGFIATRQVDYLSDGNVETTDTGTLQALGLTERVA